MTALPCILVGKTDCRASHHIHVQWMIDNPNRSEASVTGDFGWLGRNEMFKDVIIANSVRLSLLDLPWLPVETRNLLEA
eukprot:4555278-Pyramimonas_sp.AAC.1